MTSTKALRDAPHIGSVNGRLVVREYLGVNDRHSHTWMVECLICGNKYPMTSRRWKLNKTGMCNECRHSRDMLGRRFGRLTVTRFAGWNDARNRLWECKCDCGETTVVPTTLLHKGKVKSCGCLRARKGIEGQRFGKLTVLRRHGRDKRGAVLWDCQCDCGKLTVEPSAYLNKKPGMGVRSCGCDGKRHIPRLDRDLYAKWLWMRSRDHAKQWDDYETFRQWAKQTGYRKTCTLTREDPTLPYDPDNCYWLDNKLRGTKYSKPMGWKPMTVYRDGILFGEYRSLTAAAADVMEEEPGHTLRAVMLALRYRAYGKRSKPYLGRWTAEYKITSSLDLEKAS